MKTFIGISGTNCSGKGVFKEYLEKKYHAKSFSLSDILRDEAKKLKVEITRETLIELGKKLRKKDPSILAKKAIKRIKAEKPSEKIIVIDSIRNPYEVKMLKELKNFYLFFIDAPLKIRYKRALKRAREKEESLTLKKFLNLEKLEMKKNPKPYEQNLLACKKLSDFIIVNDKDLNSFYKKIDKAISPVKK